MWLLYKVYLLFFLQLGLTSGKFYTIYTVHICYIDNKILRELKNKKN